MRLNRGVLVGVLFVLAAGGLIFLLWPRGPVDPAELIKRKVVLMTHAAERKDLGEIMEQVSPRFRSADGWGRDEVKGVLAAQILSGRWVRVFTTEMSVTMTSSTTADFSGKFVFGRSDAKELKDLARDSVLSSYLIDAKLEKEADGEWRFVWAKPQQIDPASLF
jgi:hypothetical protein